MGILMHMLDSCKNTLYFPSPSFWTPTLILWSKILILWYHQYWDCPPPWLGWSQQQVKNHIKLWVFPYFWKKWNLHPSIGLFFSQKKKVATPHKLFQKSQKKIQKLIFWPIFRRALRFEEKKSRKSFEEFQKVCQRPAVWCKKNRKRIVILKKNRVI